MKGTVFNLSSETIKAREEQSVMPSEVCVRFSLLEWETAAEPRHQDIHDRPVLDGMLENDLQFKVEACCESCGMA